MIDPDANGWLPIETAPKDGTKIDLWARLEGTDIFERVTDCSWQEMADWTGAEYMGWDGLWIHRHRVFTGPTHWRPLPEPPVQP